MGLNDAGNNNGNTFGATTPAPSPLVTPSLSFPACTYSPASTTTSSPAPATEWVLLSSGVDKLHLGLYVEWGQAWRGLESVLAAGKVQAVNTDGIHATLGAAGPCIMYAKGLGNMYRYHVKHDVGDLFIAATASPSTYPNVMCWVDGRTLWQLNPVGAAGAVAQVIQSLGGRVITVAPSRVDLCADFYIPSGLTFEYLQSRQVGKRKIRPEIVGDRLESYGIGAAGASITGKIYDKLLEIGKHTEKKWQRELWPQWTTFASTARIWRMEFQLLKPALNDLGILTIDDIMAKGGGLWTYLTTQWVTFRVLDNSRSTRRTEDHGWQVVQAVAQRFGPAMTITRRIRGVNVPSSAHYLKLIAGCLPGYAARSGCPDLTTALTHLNRQIVHYFQQADFDAKYKAKSAALGIVAQPQNDASNAA
jgi:hypothetical protein